MRTLSFPGIGLSPVLGRRLLASGLVLGGLLGARAWMLWPDVRAVATAPPSAVAVIDREQAVSGAPVTSPWTPLQDVSPHLALAVIVAEDIEFFQHHGFSWSEIRFAVEDARAGGRLRGASTITQQLAKNLWLSPDRTLARKIQEGLLTVDLERLVGKRRILELYLNIAQFGPGVFGAAAGARRYFGKSPLFLTEQESAMLAAGLTRPSRWNPEAQDAEYRDRVTLVRRRMANAEFLWRHLLQM